MSEWERNFAFPSTGNAEEDEKFAQRFELHSARMQENICPNGCGKMNWIDAHSRECPVCRFAGFSTKPYDMKEGTA